MAHSPINNPLITLKGNVLTSGGSSNLAKGQLAIVSTKAVTGGLEALSDFAGLPRDAKIKIRVGRNKLPSDLTSPYARQYETSYFSPSDIISLKAVFPKVTEQKFDVFEVGYDGVNEATALNIPEGKEGVLDLTIDGKAVEILTGQMEEIVQIHFDRKVGQTMQEVVRKGVTRLQEFKVPRSQKKLKEFLDISVIDSTNVALAGVSYTFSTLVLTDDGNSNDLADIQAQYPTFKVTRTAREGKISTYTVLAPTATAVPAYVLRVNASYVKGCTNCLAGYDTIASGFVSHIVLEDNGVTQVAKIQALPGAVALSAVRVGQAPGGNGVYSVVTAAKLTNAQKATFLGVDAINSTATFKEIGDVKTICEKDTATNFAWVGGQVCFASSKKYTIYLKDTDCGTSRLSELQLAYPSLTIINAVPAATGACGRTYSTTVVTDIVCAECSPIYLQPFTAVAPTPFELFPWVAEPEVFSAIALMGIRIKGKPFMMTPSEALKNDVPFYETSTGIVSFNGGFREMDYQNFMPTYTPQELFKTRQTSRKVDRDALWANQLLLEEKSRAHFLGERSEKDNLFSKYALGEESLIDLKSQVVTYNLTWLDRNSSQSFGGSSDIKHTEAIKVEFGYHKNIELILNKLAVKAGVDTVNPTAN